MANSVQTTVAATLIGDGVINKLQDTLAPLGAFSREFVTYALAPKSTIVVPLATTAATVQTNPTTFESGDSVLSGSSVTVNEYAVSWHVNDPNKQLGVTLSHLDELNIQAFANKINDLALAPLLAANFTAATCNLTVSSSAFSTTQLKSLRGDIADQPIKNLVLDGTCFSQLIPTSLTSFPISQGASIYGFNGVYENTRLDQAGLAVNAFACSPDSICVAAGPPIRSQALGNLVSAQVLIVPGVNFPVLFEQWVSSATRAEWRSLSTMFGANYGNTSALRYYISP
jgi:hypothetical protein